MVAEEPRGDSRVTERGTGVLVSVVLATHNSMRFIEPQVSSIISQGDDVDELVVSDDGSSDATLEKLRTVVYARRQGSWLRVISTEPAGGIVQNFERALVAAKGTYIALCDHDDVWRPARVRDGLAPLHESDGPAASFSDARLIDEHGAPTGPTLFASIRLTRRERKRIRSGRAVQVLVRRNVATGATMMVNRSLLSVALPLPLTWVHDEWLAWMAAAFGRVHMIERELIDYRVHGSNAIGVESPSAHDRAARMMRPRGGRYLSLAMKYTDLYHRLSAAGAPPEIIELVARKIKFEEARARYPAARARRVIPVLKRAIRGDYTALSSQGLLDIGRDLLQPA